MRTGCPMHIVTVLPHQKQLGKGHSRRLSGKARHRLGIIDWYNQVSERKSRTGLKDASLTCRHFGIERSYFYRWYGRFKKHGIAGLENRTSRPKRVRGETVAAEIVEETRRIRQKNLTYSAKENPTHTPALLRGAQGSLLFDDLECHKAPQLFFSGRTPSRSKDGRKAE